MPRTSQPNKHKRRKKPRAQAAAAPATVSSVLAAAAASSRSAVPVVVPIQSSQVKVWLDPKGPGVQRLKGKIILVTETRGFAAAVAAAAATSAQQHPLHVVVPEAATFKALAAALDNLPEADLRALVSSGRMTLLAPSFIVGFLQLPPGNMQQLPRPHEHEWNEPPPPPPEPTPASPSPSSSSSSAAAAPPPPAADGGFQYVEHFLTSDEQASWTATLDRLYNLGSRVDPARRCKISVYLESKPPTAVKFGRSPGEQYVCGGASASVEDFSDRGRDVGERSWCHSLGELGKLDRELQGLERQLKVSGSRVPVQA